MDKHDHTRYIFAKAIKELIKTRPLDKITVIDIVTNAGKTRQTFYRYFKEAFKSNDYNNLINYDYYCIYEFYKEIIENNLNHQIDKELDFLLKMYCKGSIDMTVDWVLNDMSINIDDIVALLIEALPKRLEPFILSIQNKES